MEKRTQIGAFIKSTWTNINIRAGKYRHLQNITKCKCYKGITVEFTLEEYKNYCYLNKELILSLTRPSIDRINSNKNYSLDNIRFIELRDNIANENKTKGNKYLTNSFGIKRGVRKIGNKFSARIFYKGKEIYLGMFANEEDAYDAFKQEYYKIYNKYPW